MWLDTFGTPDEQIVFYIFCGVSGLIVILSILNIILGCFMTRNSVSISCDFHIELGCLGLAFTVLARGFDLSWTTEEKDLDIICKIYHVILLIALTQFIGGLFVKGWTLFLFYKYNSDKTPISEEWIPNLLIWILILIAVAAAMVWEFVYPPELIGESQFQCSYGDYEFEWKVGTSAWHGLLLVLALVALPANCAATRGTKGARESNILGIVVVNTVLTVVAGICIWFLMIDSDDIDPAYKPNNTIQYAILGGLMLWMCFFADFMFLVAKMCTTCGSGPSEPPADNYDTIGAGSDTNSFTHNNPSFDSNGGGKTNDTFEY